MKMPIKPKNTLPLLAFVHRNQITFFQQNWTEPVAFPMPVEVLRDLEFVQKDQACAMLKTFFTDNKIQPEEVILILSDQVTFSKELENTQESEAKSEEIRKFVQTVPFESKFSKELKFNKRTLLFCLNRNFYQPLVHCLHELKFTIGAIIPQLSFDEALQVQDLTVELSQTIWGNIDTLKKNFNFLEEERQASVTDLQKPSHEREMILVGVFVFLLAILGGVYFWTTQQSQQPVVVPSPSPLSTPISSPLPTVAPTPTPDTTVATSSAEATGTISKSLQIHILNGSGQPGQAVDIRSALQELGYLNVSTGTATNVAGARSRIVVQQSVPSTYREEVLRVVQEITSGEVVIQEDNSIEYQILITTTGVE